VAELGLADAVTFTGHAHDETVAAAYAEADVLVVTSAHEGFCVPVVEAMAAGLPVVAVEQGALPEVLGDAGTLVTSGHPYDLADAIGALLADSQRRAALTKAASGRLAELSLPSAADRLAGLLCTLLDRPGGKK
jgi:glycosyltransferase involved in cell wall biosynthesis